MSPAKAPAIGRVAFLPFGAPLPRRRRVRFRPAPEWTTVKPHGHANGFVRVRLRATYFRYVDGPPWARQVYPVDSICWFQAGEACALLDAGLAVKEG